MLAYMMLQLPAQDFFAMLQDTMVEMIKGGGLCGLRRQLRIRHTCQRGELSQASPQIREGEMDA
jgi:hypothetical protein